MRQQLGHLARVRPPPRQLPEEHDEQRRGVRRAVVGGAAAEGQAGRGAAADLVQDPSGLLLGERVDRPALVPGQGAQRPEREVAVDRQRHQRGQQRVAAEQRHEPRRAGGDRRGGRVLLVEDPERAQVLLAAPQGRLQSVVRGGDDPARPRATPAAGRPAATPRAAGPNGNGGRDLAALDDRDAPATTCSTSPRGGSTTSKCTRPAPLDGLDERSVAGLDDGRPTSRTPLLLEDEAAALDVRRRSPPGRTRPALTSNRSAKSASSRERHAARAPPRDRSCARVRSSRAPSPTRRSRSTTRFEPVRREPRTSASEEHGAVRVRRHDRQRLGGLPSTVRSQACRIRVSRKNTPTAPGPAEVAVRRADAERGALDRRHHVPRRGDRFLLRVSKRSPPIVGRDPATGQYAPWARHMLH